MKKLSLFAIAFALVFGAPNAMAERVAIKKKAIQSMTPEQLAAYKARIAEVFTQRARTLPMGGGTDTPADTCPSATNEVGTLPFNTSGTTVGLTDDYDLDVGVPSGCTLGGNSYTGTGVAPDIGYRVQVDNNCTLSIAADPEAAFDLALVIYTPQCSNAFGDCVVVDDDGLAGDAENATFAATAGTDYFVVIDGYSTGGTPPGPSGTYTLAITGSGCSLVPVELQEFSVE